MSTVKWTYEACIEVAKTCISRSELRKKHGRAYEVSRVNGWLGDYTWFRPTSEVKSKAMKGLNAKWSYEKCYEAAKGCTSKVELRKNFNGAYQRAYTNGWLDDYTWFITKSQAQSKSLKVWDKKACFEAAKGCKSRSELAIKHRCAYETSRVNGWLDDYTWFRPTSELKSKAKKGKASPLKVWTREKCFEAAKECTSRSEFAIKYGGAYKWATANNWIEEMFPLSIDVYGNCDNVYRYYFKDFNAIYVGRTIRPKRRDRDHIFHVDKDTVAKFAHEHNVSVPPMEILVSNIALNEGQRLEKFYVDLYREQGYTILNKAKAGALGKLKLK